MLGVGVVLALIGAAMLAGPISPGRSPLEGGANCP